MEPRNIPLVAAAAAAGLLLLDAFVLGQGVLPLFVGVLVCVAQGPAAVLAARRGELDLAWRRGMRVAFFVVAAGLSVVAVRVNNNVARGRAERIVAAAGRHRQAKGCFPERLEELVPEFLPSVPRAKPVALYSDFRYDTVGSRHRLSWRVFPPRGWRFVFVEDGAEGFRER